MKLVEMERALVRTRQSIMVIVLLVLYNTQLLIFCIPNETT